MIRILIFLSLSVPVFAQKNMMNMSDMAPMNAIKTKNIFILQMDTMMRKMDKVNLTNAIESDFLRLMIPHHQGAVKMSLYEIAHGNSKEMIQLAKSIIAEQQMEIKMMNKLLSFAYNPVPIDIKTQWDATMNTMMKDMPKTNTFKNIDVAFAKVMMPHHQAGIDMAKILLKYGNDYKIIRMAENIISSQEIEIEQMKNYIK